MGRLRRCDTFRINRYQSAVALCRTTASSRVRRAWSSSERQNLAELVLDRVKLRSGQLAHPAGDHVVLDGSDDASDDRRVQKTGFAPSLDLVVSHQESTDVAGDGSEDRLSPTLMIPVGADDETGPLFGAFLVRKDELDQDDIARLRGWHHQADSSES